jgi:lipoprotein-anchoring transpeptidase ErfK/SrfK
MKPTRCCLMLLLAIGAALPSATPSLAAHHRHPTAPVQQQKPPFNQAVLDAEVMLDRNGFSPGVIDGRDGDNFANALHAFQQVNGLAAGRLDQQTMERLAQTSNAPSLGQYTIPPADVQGPFTPQIPQDFTKMATLPRLGYRSPQQLLTEKFHMSEGLLAALNPGKNFSDAGTVITVPNVAAMPEDPKLAVKQREGSGSSTQEQPKAAKIVVDKRNHAVMAFGPDNRLLGFYPASIGSTEKPAPSGSFVVRSVAYDPDYTYNPAYGFRGQKAERPVKVAPGPNNPVGLVWIGLSAKGYGIHGAPDPDQIGKSQSHGCVRLTNWDALALAKFVKRGTPVEFVG